MSYASVQPLSLEPCPEVTCQTLCCVPLSSVHAISQEPHRKGIFRPPQIQAFLGLPTPTYTLNTRQDGKK